jgi:hypothetical protein
MARFSSKLLFYFGACMASLMMIFNAGCASGGFKLTRQYAGFVNRQDLIIRILLYIFTSVVFAITMIIDLVAFNTMDFWEGRVSQGTYEFNSADKKFVAHHEVLPGTQLKRSTIDVYSKQGDKLQTVVLRETAQHQIEVLVDGHMRMRVDHIRDIPVASRFDVRGILVGTTTVPMGKERAVAGLEAL